jgi:Ca2+-binding EF-hand superfamily protein
VQNPDELFREALTYIDDDELFLSYSLSLIEHEGPASSVHFMRHTRDGREKICPISLNLSHDEIRWPHSSVINRVKRICGHQDAQFDLAHARKLVHGQRTNAFRINQERKKTCGPDFLDRSFSIVGASRSLDVVAPSREAAKVWSRTIELLLDKFQSDNNTFQSYIELHWDKADTDRSGSLTFSEVQEVIQNMSINFNKPWFEKKFSQFDTDGDRTMNKDEFAQFTRHLFSDRPEVEQLVVSISSDDEDADMPTSSSAADSKRLSGQTTRISLQAFIRFWNVFQRNPLQDEMDEDDAKSIFRRIVGSDAQFLDIMEFATYLDSRENDVFDPSRSAPGCGSDNLKTYMSQPVSAAAYVLRFRVLTRPCTLPLNASRFMHKGETYSY